MATIIETYSGGLRVECEHTQSGTKIITDAPTDNNGKGEAFSPTDLCCAALGACAMTIIGIWAEKRDVDVRGTRVEVNKTMAAGPAPDRQNRGRFQNAGAQLQRQGKNHDGKGGPQLPRAS